MCEEMEYNDKKKRKCYKGWTKRKQRRWSTKIKSLKEGAKAFVVHHTGS